MVSGTPVDEVADWGTVEDEGALDGDATGVCTYIIIITIITITIIVIIITT